MTTYFVTGATGFLGRRLLAALLTRLACERVFALVGPHSVGKLPEHPKLTEVVGDLTAPIEGEHVDHVVHLGALYDLTASLEDHTATDLVVRALVEKPEEVNVPFGVAADLARRVAPRTTRALAHLAYRVFPEDSTPPLASVAAGLTRLALRGLR